MLGLDMHVELLKFLAYLSTGAVKTTSNKYIYSNYYMDDLFTEEVENFTKKVYIPSLNLVGICVTANYLKQKRLFPGGKPGSSTQSFPLLES